MSKQIKRWLTGILVMLLIIGTCACSKKDDSAKGNIFDSTTEESSSEASSAEESTVPEESSKEESSIEESSEEGYSQEESSKEESSKEESSKEESSEEESSEESSEEAPAAETLAGFYKLTGLTDETGEVPISDEELAAMEAMGMYCYMELWEDHTGELSMGGEKTPLTWEGMTVTSNGESVPATVKDDQLTLEADGRAMHFVKLSEEEAARIKQSEEAGGQSESEESSESESSEGSSEEGGIVPISESLVGKYHLIEVRGEENSASPEQIQALEAMGMVCVMELNEDGKGTIYLFGETQDMTWTETGLEADGDTLPMSVDGENLIVEEPDDILVFEKISDEDYEHLKNLGEEDPEPGEESSEESSEEPAEEDPGEFSMESYKTEEEVIADTDDVKIIITGYSLDDFWGWTINFTCENKTTDKTLMFSMRDVIIDGYSLDPYWSTKIAAGKNDKSTAHLSLEELKKCGITSIDEIKTIFYVFDYDNWADEAVLDEEKVIYPTGKDPADIKYPERRPTGNDFIIGDTDEFTFIIYQTEADSWGYNVEAFIENKTENSLLFSWDDVSINGTMVDPYFSTIIPAGTKKFQTITFYSSSLEDSGIEIDKIEDIEFKQKVSNMDDWSAPALLEEVFTYHIEAKG